MGNVIIEVRLNELSRRDSNPNIPYSPAEIVADAVRCEQAGASIAHFHGRRPDGSESEAYGDFETVVSGLRAESDLVIHPTLGRFSEGVDGRSRLRIVEALAARARLRPDLAPLDLGSSNLDVWDPEGKRFLSVDTVYRNATGDLLLMADDLRRLKVMPQLAIWGMPGIRLLRAMYDSGYLTGPIYVSLLFTGESRLFGHPATEAGLQAYLSLLGDLPVIWTAMVNGADYFPFLPHVLDAGGHVSIGLGDFPYADDGCPGNADLIRRVATVAERAGRPVASPRETRALLNLAPGRTAAAETDGVTSTLRHSDGPGCLNG